MGAALVTGHRDVHGTVVAPGLDPVRRVPRQPDADRTVVAAGLHQVRYDDHGEVRDIAHRLSLAEMVVPYGDPAPTHRRKNAFDAGEYNVGALANAVYEQHARARAQGKNAREEEGRGTSGVRRRLRAYVSPVIRRQSPVQRH